MAHLRIHSTTAGVHPRRVRRPDPGRAARARQLLDGVFSSALEDQLDWRRTFQLWRRLLSGDLSVLGETARVEADTRPALAVLLIGMLAAGIGSWLWLVVDAGGLGIGAAALQVLLFGTLATLGAWSLWLGVTWYALRSIFEISAEPRALLRTMALSGGFVAWQFFMLAGPASFAIGLISTIGVVLLTVLAVRAATPPADDRAAIVSVAVGFGVYAFILSIIADVAGVGTGFFVHAIG